MTATSRTAALILVAIATARPASAQWTQVADIPTTTLFSVWVIGDTIATGADTATYVSTDAGATWTRSARVAAGVSEIERVRMHNGRLYAGDRGQGVFVSDNLGATWSGFNQGLVGGINNAQLFIIDMLVRGDSLYLATDGAGPWVRRFGAPAWSRFGNALIPAQAGNMTVIAANDSRYFAAGGGNGTVYFRDVGQPDWTESLLFNDRLAAGLVALSAVWTGSRWVVGSNIGIFLSAQGESPWTFVDPGAGRPLFTVPLAMRGHDLFANFGTFSSTLSLSRDEGSSWQTIETLPVPISGLAVVGNTLYASRLDGLWRRTLDDIPNVSVPPRAHGLGFAIAGAAPVRDDVRFRFELPSAGRAEIDVFDLAGRRVASPVDATFPAGPNELAWDARALTPGIYHARMMFEGRTEAARLVRVR